MQIADDLQKIEQMKLSPNDGNLNDQMRNYGSLVHGQFQKTVKLPKNAGVSVSNKAKQNNHTQLQSFDTDESPRNQGSTKMMFKKNQRSKVFEQRSNTIIPVSPTARLQMNQTFQ